mgnify:CR=1 FL=1
MSPANSKKEIINDNSADYEQCARRILAWYDGNKRDLPWRDVFDKTSNNVEKNVYYVWLSEIMLQQTTVQAVIPYFLKFTKLWPDIDSLAQARDEDVMNAWAGLGYYARARNLLKCAREVSFNHNGVFPSEYEALLKLPGIGSYTAAAITAIAYNKPAVVIDGNIERICARLESVETPLPGAKSQLKEIMAGLSACAEDRPGDFAQAMMDIGATICRPKKPLCTLCPANLNCKARLKKNADNLPVKILKQKQKRAGEVFVIKNTRNQVLIERRRPARMLGGMLGLPSTSWDHKEIRHRNDMDDELKMIIEGAEFQSITKKTVVKHVFTHFELTLAVSYYLFPGHFKPAPMSSYFWSDAPQDNTGAFPTLFRKVLKLL